MELTKKQIKIARTKSGSPCLWESYIEFDDLKRATVIIDKDGSIKKSIFIRKNSDKQSLVPIQEGDFLIKIFEDKEGVSKSILEIQEISNMSNHASLMLAHRSGPNIETIESPKFSTFARGIENAEIKMYDKEFIASSLFDSTTKDI